MRRATHRRTIFIAAAPKSGSTWLTSMLSGLEGMHLLPPPPMGGRRELEILDGHLVRPRSVLSHLVDCQHVRASEHTLVQLARADAYPVVLTRNIADSLVSMHDHISGRKAGSVDPSMEPGHRWSMAYLTSSSWGRLSTADQYRVLVLGFMPWYVNFELSWGDWRGIVAEHELRGSLGDTLHEPIYVDYDHMRSSPHATIRAIVDHVGINASGKNIAAAVDTASALPTRRNLLVPGRGRDLMREFPFVADALSAWMAIHPELRSRPGFQTLNC